MHKHYTLKEITLTSPEPFLFQLLDLEFLYLSTEEFLNNKIICTKLL